MVCMASQTRRVSSRVINTATGDMSVLNRTVSSSPGKRHSANTSGRSHSSGSGSKRSEHRTPNGSGRGNRPRKKRHVILKWVLAMLGIAVVCAAGLFAYLWFTTEIPQPEKIAMAEKTEVYFADGTTKIGTFAEQNREIIDCSVLPEYVRQAVVASENRTFYSDKGIDPKGIARAFINNVKTGSRQGGSTITQQYAERYYLGETTSYLGKMRESVLALKIAQTEDKDEVLCNYMNTIYLGRGAYGIEAAAQTYFNKQAKDLTLSEAAMLAGIIPSPSTWDPAKNPDQAQSRLTRVLGMMVEDGYITEDQQSEAATLPKTVETSKQNVYAGPNGYLLQMVRTELVNTGVFTEEDLDTGGYTIITTIDKAKQDLMYQVASPTQPDNDIRPEGLQIGSMSLDPKTGGIICLYAGDDYLSQQLNNATQAIYEPGSTMKPFALLATIQNGVSLNTYFDGNSPQTYAGITEPVENFGDVSYGTINLYRATANSVNTVFMKLQEKLGAAKVAETAVAAGVDPSRVKGDNPFTVLGNDGVHVSDMAQAYATIVNQGNKQTLHIIATVKNSQGADLYTAPTNAERVFDANDVALVEKAMTGTIEYGTATEAQNVGKTLAGKSGSANDKTAGSFVGFTPSTLTIFAMWYPDADGNVQEIPSFAGYSGGSDYPIHLFTTYMEQALEDTPDEEFPEVSDSGKVGGPDGTWGTGSRTRTYSKSSSPNSSQTSPSDEGEGEQSTPEQSESTQSEQSQEQDQEQGESQDDSTE